MGPMPDVEKELSEHADRAYRLAIMSPRPPGYDEVAWACVLFDTNPDVLKARFDQRVQLEVDRSAMDGKHDPLFDEWMLPAIPKARPPVLRAKVTDKIAKAYHALALFECQETLALFRSVERDADRMRAAGLAVNQCLQALILNHEFPAYKAKLTMNKDGSFKIVLTPRGGP